MRKLILICISLISASSFAHTFLRNSVLKIRSTNEKLLNASDLEADIAVVHHCLTGLPFFRMEGSCGFTEKTVKVDGNGNLIIPEMDNPSKSGIDVASKFDFSSYHSLTIRFFDKQSRSKNRPLFSFYKQNQEILTFKENFDGRTLWLTPIPEIKINMSLKGSPILGSQLSQGAGNYLTVYFSIDRNRDDTSLEGGYQKNSIMVGNIQDRSLAETSNYLTIPPGIFVRFDEPASKIHIDSKFRVAQTQWETKVVGRSTITVDASDEAMSSIGTIDLN